MKVWVLSIPPNVIGVYSSEEKAADARAELDDDLYMKVDEWVWEVDKGEIEED